MKLWTIQNKVAYEKFKDIGILRADKNFIHEDMIFYYNWMSNQMKKKDRTTCFKRYRISYMDLVSMEGS